MGEINNRQYQVKVLSPSTFGICNTLNYSQYTSGGTIKKIKRQINISFQDLKAQFKPTE